MTGIDFVAFFSLTKAFLFTADTFKQMQLELLHPPHENDEFLINVVVIYVKVRV